MQHATATRVCCLERETLPGNFGVCARGRQANWQTVIAATERGARLATANKRFGVTSHDDSPNSSPCPFVERFACGRSARAMPRFLAGGGVSGNVPCLRGSETPPYAGTKPREFSSPHRCARRSSTSASKAGPLAQASSANAFMRRSSGQPSRSAVRSIHERPCRCRRSCSSVSIICRPLRSVFAAMRFANPLHCKPASESALRRRGRGRPPSKWVRRPRHPVNLLKPIYRGGFKSAPVWPLSCPCMASFSRSKVPLQGRFFASKVPLYGLFFGGFFPVLRVLSTIRVPLF